MHAPRETRRFAAAVTSIGTSPFAGKQQFFNEGPTRFQRATQDEDEEPNACAQFASRIVCGVSGLALLLLGLLLPLLFGLGFMGGALAFSGASESCVRSHLWNTKLTDALLDEQVTTPFATCDVCKRNGTMPVWIMLEDACAMSLVNGLLCEPKYVQRAPGDLLKLCIDRSQLANLQSLQRCRVQRVTDWMKTKIFYVPSQGTAQTVLYTDGLLFCADDPYFTALETRMTGRSPDVNTNPRPPPFPPNASPLPASPPATLGG